MSDNIDMVLKLLEKIESRLERSEERSETRHEKLAENVQNLKETQLKTTMTLGQMEADISLIRVDLNEHMAGTIENRHRIGALESVVKDQDAVINKAVDQYRLEVAPVVAHVQSMQAMPAKAYKWIIKASKLVAAIAAIIASSGGIIAYFMGWFGK